MSHPVSHLETPGGRTFDTFITYFVLGLIIVLPLACVVIGCINAMLPSNHKFLGAPLVSYMYCGPSCQASLGIKWVFANWYVPLAILMGLYGAIRGIIDSIFSGIIHTVFAVLLRIVGFSAIYHIKSWAPPLNDLLHPVYAALKWLLDTGWDIIYGLWNWTLFTFFSTRENFWSGLATAVWFTAEWLLYGVFWALVIAVALVVLVALFGRRKPKTAT